MAFSGLASDAVTLYERRGATQLALLAHRDARRVEVTMLDVGQGLAVVIERQGAAILYDTGPAWPGGR